MEHGGNLYSPKEELPSLTELGTRFAGFGSSSGGPLSPSVRAAALPPYSRLRVWYTFAFTPWAPHSARARL